MCLSAADVNPLCDDCFAKERDGEIGSEDDLCESCRAMLKCYCYCCMTMYSTPEEGGFEDGICRECRTSQEEPVPEMPGHPSADEGPCPAKDGGR